MNIQEMRFNQIPPSLPITTNARVWGLYTSSSSQSSGTGSPLLLLPGKCAAGDAVRERLDPTTPPKPECATAGDAVREERLDPLSTPNVVELSLAETEDVVGFGANTAEDWWWVLCVLADPDDDDDDDDEAATTEVHPRWVG